MQGYFQTQRSAGETLGAVADFYDGLYTSPQYASYVQAKELLSHLEGYQSRFMVRNVDRLLRSADPKAVAMVNVHRPYDCAANGILPLDRSADD